MKRKRESYAAIVKRISTEGPNCSYHPGTQPIESVSQFLEIIESSFKSKDFWFRGHPSHKFRLTPSALRFSKTEQRDAAFDALEEFKRLVENKLPKPPGSDKLRWIQLAQHFGLPTRLLDWTQNPLVALYFASLPNSEEKDDALVFLLNPKDLSPRKLDKENRRQPIHNSEIEKYLSLTGNSITPKLKTIAFYPSWNSERIILQQGAFTLHGTQFELDKTQAPSLVAIPLLHSRKANILDQLERVGICEMFLFPEIEHTCNQLKRQISKSL